MAGTLSLLCPFFPHVPYVKYIRNVCVYCTGTGTDTVNPSLDANYHGVLCQYIYIYIELRLLHSTLFIPLYIQVSDTTSQKTIIQPTRFFFLSSSSSRSVPDFLSRLVLKEPTTLFSSSSLALCLVSIFTVPSFLDRETGEYRYLQYLAGSGSSHQLVTSC